VERAAFLERLRAQLRRQPGPPQSPVPRPSPERRALGDQERLELFIARLQELGGAARVVTTRAAAQAEVDQLMADRGWSSVACAAELRWPAIDDKWTAEPRGAPFGLSSAELAVAETGSVLLSNHGRSGRGYSLIPPAIGVFVARSQLVGSIGDALRWISSQGSDLPACLSFITGPSNTADIASVQVIGVHGPGEVFVWVISDTADGE
jgi:L-lactate utilization protein LutC